MTLKGISALDAAAMATLTESPQPAWAYDIEHDRIEWANPAGLALWRADDIASLESHDLRRSMSRESRRQLEAYFVAVRDGAIIEKQLTVYPAGEPVTLVCQCRGVRTDDGRTVVLVAGRVRTIEAGTLRAVEALNNTSCMVSLLDFEGHVLFENPAALGTHGFTRPSASAPHAFETRFVDREAASEAWTRLLVDEAFEGQLEVDTREGRRWHEVSADTTTDPVTGVRVILLEERDVTDRRRLERRVHLNERMSSIGVLAGALTHQINNPLAYASMNIDLLEELRADGLADAHPEELRTILTDIREGIDRIRSTVADLAELARVDTGAPVAADIQSVLETAITMATAQVKHSATVERDFGEVPHVLGRRTRLSETFLHVLLHAVRRLDTENASADNLVRVSTRHLEDPDRVVIEIADNGPELSPEQLSQVFEPFSTVAPREDDGLGLLLARRIVTDHGGELSARTNDDRGLTIRIELPPAADHQSERPMPAPRHGGGARRVLVLDDEPGIRRAITRLLDEHEVDAAASGPEALALVEAKDYDVIFCDMMMPVMDGTLFYEKVRESYPGVEERIVFITGGAFTRRAAAFLEGVPNPTVAKPFSRALLRTIVERS